ncbi:DMT family transporter [Reinekea sp.]|uniref:DMT family transporter n=1 Tax=Reinekea sp. TaxID=1970455 RepID=UPI00257AF618|nr:DMT family transporter [Reinekea sp.]
MTTSTHSPSGLAMLSAIVAAVGMGTIGVFSRMAELSPEIVTFYRLFLGALFMGAWLVVSRQSIRIGAGDGGRLLLSGAFLAGFILCYIQAMNLTAMANAILVIYLAPIAATLFSRLFFHEMLKPQQWLAMALALLGFILMQDAPDGNSASTLGLAYAGLAMLFYAGFIIVNRRCSEHTPAASRAFWQLATGALLTLLVSLASQQSLVVEAGKIPWLLAIGFIPGFVALYCAVLALQRLPTAVYGTLSYFEPVAVIVFGWLFFAETLSAGQFLGCVLILGSGIGPALMAAVTARPIAVK